MGSERRDRTDQGRLEANPRGEEPRGRPRPKMKSFEIPKRLLIEDGDVVVVEWNVRGVVSGPIPLPDGTELAPTGRTVDYGGVTVARLRDGKIAAMHDYCDNLATMTQLGLMPGA